MKRAKMVALPNLSKNARIKRIINIVTEVVLMLAATGMAIYFLVIGDPRNRLMSCVGTIVAFGSPLILELILKRRFTFLQHLLLEIYMFFTMFLGSILYLHHSFAPFDEISHVLFGYFSCIAIFYGFMYTHALDKNKRISAGLIILMISMGAAAVWEILEFSMDVFFDENSMGFPFKEAERLIKNANLKGIAANIESLKYTSVIDTATDMALHLAGSIVFMAQHFIHIFSGKNLLLGSLTKEVKKNEMNTDVKAINKEEQSMQNPQTDNLQEIENI